MRISDWSSDVCSSDLGVRCRARAAGTASERTGHGTERAAGLRLFVGYLAHGGPCADATECRGLERVRGNVRGAADLGWARDPRGARCGGAGGVGPATGGGLVRVVVWLHMGGCESTTHHHKQYPTI